MSVSKRAAIQWLGSDAVAQKRLLEEAAWLAASWQDLAAERLRAILGAMVTKVQVHSDRVDVTLDQMGVALWLNAKDQPRPIRAGGNDREQYLTVLTIPARLKRTGIEMRLVVDDGSSAQMISVALAIGGREEPLRNIGVTGGLLAEAVGHALTSQAEEVRALATKMAAAASEPLKEQVKRGVDELRKAN